MIRRIFAVFMVMAVGLYSSDLMAQTPVKIMPLGDSITRGVRGSVPVGGYRDDLDSLLTNAGVNFDFVGSLQDGDATRFDVDHEGHGGWRADEIDAQINTWLNQSQPDIVLLHIGTNDVSNGDPNNSTIVEIESIVDKIHAYNANTAILLCSLIPRNDAKNSKNEELNVYIEDLFYRKKQAGYKIYYVGQNELFETNPNWAVDYLDDAVHPNNTGYYMMAQAFFSAIMNVLNGTAPYVTDNFNRLDLGTCWVAESTISIVGNELVNLNPNHDQMSDWDLAIYRAQTNPSRVSFTWGAGADSLGIQEGGFALRLNSTDPATADGYLVWIGPNNKVNLWTIVDGVPESLVPGQSVPSAVPFPKAGDRMRVDLSSDEFGYHFDVYVNDVLAARVSDSNRLQGQSIIQYSGVILRGGTNLNNPVDDFDIYKEGDVTPPDPITDLHVTSVSSTTITLSWTAPGDDGSTGLAVRYDIRYATFQIDATNFDSATPIADPPLPAPAGTVQDLTITGLQPNTTYYFAIKTMDDVPNVSDLSNVAVGTTTQGLEFIDTFERTSLGPDWTAEPEFTIVNGELSNTSLVEDWNFIAVYNARRNPLEVAFTYGQQAQAQDIENVAIVFLNAADVNASGYMTWYRPSKNGIYLWEVVNGIATRPIANLDNVGLPDAVAGDELKVALRHDNQGNHFDFYINNQFYGTLTDPNNLYGVNGDLYAGVMMHGNRNNNIDNFRILLSPGSPSDIVKVSGDFQTAPIGTTLPQPFVVRVTDNNGNPVPGVDVSFTVQKGAGTFDRQQGDGNIRIEAEYGNLLAPMASISDSTASGGYYVTTDVVKGGRDDINFSVSQDGNYYIWGRVYAPNAEANSFFVLMDNQVDTILWDIAVNKYGQWVWERISDRTRGEIVFQLQAGSHTLHILGRESLSRLDKILITSDPNYVPSGLEPPRGYITDQSGEVHAYFTLGTVAGEQQIVATSTVLPGKSVLFTVNALPGDPANIAKISGDGQTGAGGDTLANPLVVQITDQYGNPVPNVDVYFVVISGGGTIVEPQPVKTDANGYAASTLILGKLSSLNQVKAYSPGTQPAEVVFSLTATGVASKIVSVSGNQQQGVVGKQLANPLVVQVLNDQGNPISEVPVEFVITAGGGSIVEQQPVLTDANGYAQIHWILGTVSGIQKVEARATGLQGSPLLFTAMANPDAPVKLVKASADSLSGTVSNPLSQPFAVRVVDQYNNGVPGDTVLFTVLEGGGHFQNGQSSQAVLTDSTGMAKVTLVLGPVAGQYNNKVQASRQGLQGSPIVFVASANPGSAAKITYVSGNGQIGYVREPLPNPLVVKVLDASDNPVANQLVVFEVISGGGTLNGDTLTRVEVYSDQNGLASVTFWPGPDAGQDVNVIHASANNGQAPLANSPIVFKISAKYRGTKIVKVSGDGQTGVAGTVLSNPLVVKVLDANDQPVANHPVTFKVISGGGKLEPSGAQEVVVRTDAQGQASVQFRLGPTAGQNNNVVHAIATDGFDPLTGSPVEFKASATASNATAITIVSGNNQTGTVGEPLPAALKVKVVDDLGNGVANHEVTFRVIEGGGHFQTANSDTLLKLKTDQNGIASVVLVLGTVAGTGNNRVEVTSTDGINPLQGSPLIFVASANPGPTDPDRSTVTATSPVVADGNAVSTITVTLVDRYGNPIAGKTVEVLVSGSQNFIVQPSAPTNDQGTVTATLSSVKAEKKVVTAKNKTDNITLNSSAVVEFVPGPAARLLRTSGNDQTRNVGTVLKDPLVVTVTDFYNNPVSGIPVYFEVKSGGGRIIESQPVVTDSAGQAKVHYILGDQPGTNLVEAKSGNLMGSPVLFTATGVVSNPAKILYVSGNDQVGKAGSALPKPFVVQVVDNAGNPVKNVQVTFKVVFGNGQISPAQPVLTDAFGKAAAVLTLGPQVGAYIVNAEASGLQGSPVAFVANAVHADAAKVVKYAGDGYEGAVTTVGNVKVQVQDQYGNPVDGYPVQFQVVQGDVTITNPQPDTTDVNGIATAVYRFGTKSGDVIIQAVADGLTGSPLRFYLKALPDAPVAIELAGGNNQIGTVGHTFLDPLEVRVVDQYGNPVPNYPVTYVVTSGDATIVGNQVKNTGSNGIAACEVRAGSTAGQVKVLAVASGLDGSPIEFILQAVQNNFPVMNDIPNATVQENQWLRFDVTASDPDNDPLEFNAYNLPSGAQFDSVASNTYRFSWKPGFDQAGSYQVIFEVLDGKGGFAVDTVTITVVNVNRKPVIVYYSPSSDTAIEKGQLARFYLRAEDPDNDPLQYFWKVNGQRVADGMIFNFRPTLGISYVIVGFVTDGYDTVSHQWNITVTGVELEMFTARAMDGQNAILLEWKTSYESRNLGFNVYRSTDPEQGFLKLNTEIIKPAKSGEYRFVDNNVDAGHTYYYKIEDVSFDGKRTLHGPVAAQVEMPVEFVLEQNYPNPFNPETTIRFALPKRVHVYLAIYNVLGQEVRVLVDRELMPGYHSFVWDGRDKAGRKVNSGLYYYRFRAGEFTTVKKMLLLK